MRNVQKAQKLTSNALSMFDSARSRLTKANELLDIGVADHRSKAAEHRAESRRHESEVDACRSQQAANARVIEKLHEFTVSQ